MSGDTIDALIAMSERINDLIAIENEKLEKDEVRRMNVPWPQYLVITMYVLHILSHVVLDGKPRGGNYSAGVATASIAISAFVLWRGGFWTVLGVAP